VDACRWRRRRVDRRHYLPARPGRLARGHAGHRPQGTPASGGAVAVTETSTGTGFTAFATGFLAARPKPPAPRSHRRSCSRRTFP